jgi:ketosteroid isomerase-like protein
MTNPLEVEILEQEARLTEATRALDVDALDGIYADDLLMTGVLGEPTCTKKAVIDEAHSGASQRAEAAAAGTPLQTSYQKEDIKVTALGNAAVSSYRFVVTLTGTNLDVYRRYRTTNVWMKRSGRWQVVAAHTSQILDATQLAHL